MTNKTLVIHDHDSSRALIAATILGTVGASTILLMPGLLGVIVTALGLTESQLGFVASVDIFTFAIATGLSALVIGRMNWRILALIGLVILGIGNLFSLLADNYSAMLVSRVIAGTGEGIAVAVSFAALGATSKPDRSFAIYLVFALIFSAIALYLFPYLVSGLGHQSVFIFLIALCVVNILFLPWLVSQSIVREVAPGKEVPLPYLLAGIGLAMVVLFFIAQGAVWSYLERIGMNGGISASTVGGALALSALAGVLGAGLATLLGDRFGRLLPITFGLILQAISMILLTMELSVTLFYVAVMAFNFSWNLCQPYFSGIMAELDPEGRIVVLMGSLQTVGVAAGPFLAALIISPGHLESISYLGIACLAGTFVLTYLLLNLWKAKQAQLQPAF